MKFLLLILFFIFYSEKTNAACKCMCVDGEMEPICTSALDIPLPCIGICSIVPPSIPPITSPKIPPIGTTKCEMRQVKSPYSGRYEWKEVCYK